MYGPEVLSFHLFQVSASTMASSTSKEAEKVKPVLTINELGDTLKDPEVLDKFRETLRALDGKSKAAPSVKGNKQSTIDPFLSCNCLHELQADLNVTWILY